MERFTALELRQLRRLRTPAGIQRLVDEIPYHFADTVWSPRRVLRARTAHCLEAAIFAAAALRVLGYPPLIMDLEADRDTDHVVALFRVGSCWGAVAKSNFAGLRYREPVHRNLRELAISYFDDYFSLRRRRTLRRYSRPVNLARFDRQEWMTSEKSLWLIPDYLCDVSHTRLLSSAQARALQRLDHRSYQAGMFGFRQH